MGKFIKAAFLLGCLTAFGQAAQAGNLTGAGSTFVYPIMAQWAAGYQKVNGSQINYQAIGSGGGVSQIKAGTVDFAATDKPLPDADLKAANLQQFPLVKGGLVVSVNIKSLKQALVLDGSTLANIFAGTVTYWDDASIKALNPKLSLPHQMITVVFRADGSGTTYNFTQYLVSVSPNFAKMVGSDTLVSWTAASKIGAKGNAGVANYIKSVNGSIGYVEYAYAKQNNLTTVNMKNAAGNIISPDLQSFAAAANNSNGKQSWPIMATTYVLLPNKNVGNAKNLATSYAFFSFCFEKGQAMANNLDYVPLPKAEYENIVKHFN